MVTFDLVLTELEALVLPHFDSVLFAGNSKIIAIHLPSQDISPGKRTSQKLGAYPEDVLENPQAICDLTA